MEVRHLNEGEISRRIAKLENWRLNEEGHLRRSYTFPDFRSALAFANLVGEAAESAQHHPDILVGWGKVGITLWTHSVDGLSEKDFHLAAEIESLAREL